MLSDRKKTLMFSQWATWRCTVKTLFLIQQCIFKASIVREQSTQMNDTSKHTLILYCFTDSHIYFKLNHTHTYVVNQNLFPYKIFKFHFPRRQKISIHNIYIFQNLAMTYIKYAVHYLLIYGMWWDTIIFAFERVSGAWTPV